MVFVYILLILFILLLALVAMATILKLAILVTTRFKYETNTLMLPSLLSIGVWCSAIIAWIIIVTKLAHINFLDFILYVLVIPSKFNNIVIPILLISAGLIIFSILLQSLCMLTVNIDYVKLKGKIRTFLKKLFKVKEKETEENVEIVVDERPPKLGFINSFVASLFSFSLVFFTILILLTIGYLVSGKVLNMLL